jgi:type I restriction enzyme S subunit
MSGSSNIQAPEIQLPEYWARARVGDIIHSPETASPAHSGGVTFKYVDIQSVDNLVNRIADPKVLPCATPPSRARNIIRSGDVIISLVRPYLKNIALVPESLDGQWASTAFCVCRPCAGVDKRFLFYYFLQDTFLRAIPTYGDSPPSGHDGDLFAWLIPLPPPDEQVRIADRLDELFTDLTAGVAALERVRRKLKRYRSAVLHAAVTGRLTAKWRKEHGPPAEPGDKLLARILIERRRQWEARTLAKYDEDVRQPPKNWRDRYPTPVEPKTDDLPELPKGWCWASVDQLLVEGLCSGISVKGSDSPPGVAALKLNALTDNGFDYAAIRFIPIDEATASANAVHVGDFFVSRGNGSLRLLGRGTVAQQPPFAVVFPDTMIRFRLSSHASHFPTVWPSPLIRRQIEQLAKTTAGIHKVSQADLESVVLPLPSIEEQSEIVAAVQEKLSQIDAMEAEVERGLARASRLRQAILKSAFAGKLVPQDPNDEPAEVLLERIKAERAQQHAVSNGRIKRTTSKKAVRKRAKAKASRAAKPSAKRKQK